MANFCGLCFGAEIRKSCMPPVNPQFYYLTFGCDGDKKYTGVLS